MARVAAERSAKWVAKLTQPGLHAVGGVSGLCLQVISPTSRSWVLRVTMPSGKRRSMGLGPYPLVGLADARESARTARLKMRDHVDPIEEAKAVKSALRATEAKQKTFRDAAEAYIETREKGWRNSRSGTAWTSSLSMHAYPVIGDLSVAHVEKAHLIEVLKPIWTNDKDGRLVTAMRLRGRIERILDYAREHGWRPEGPNPAQWKGRLENALPDPSQLRRVKPVKHHDSIPFDEIGAFMRDLRAVEGVGASCLELLTLTATRSGEARGARWSELKLDAATPVWTIPADRMKAGREHIVPLSRQAVKLLKAQPRYAYNDLVFPSPQSQGVLSDMTMLELMKRMTSKGVPHGMRSCFRTWVAERTSFQREVAEAALAHINGDRVEAAYLHTTHFKKRVRLMQEWANYLDMSEAEQDGDNIVPINMKIAAE
jgi:integrase